MNQITGLNMLINRVIPMVYDDSLSYIELLYKVSQKLDEVITATNTFISQDISAELVIMLQDYKNSGELDALIESVLGAEFPISPDQFTGTDAVRVQSALDLALTTYRAVRLSRMYDITGSTLLINRPYLYYASERRQLMIQGNGGGLKKTDAGFLFDALYANTGDILTTNMRYESVTGSGTKIWNGDKIIRLLEDNAEYYKIDTIMSAPIGYSQSTRFLNSHITGGAACKFEAKQFIDFTLSNCLIEDCVNLIRNTEALSTPMCSGVRILNNVIENLTGKTIYLGGSSGLIISGNYFEVCNEYIDLDGLTTNYPHLGIEIHGNQFYLSATQLAAQTPAISIKNVNEYTLDGNGGCFSSGNMCAGSTLYDLTNMGVGQFITGVGDLGAIINPGQYIGLGKPHNDELADGFVRTKFGREICYIKQFSITNVAANSDTVLTINTLFDLTQFSIVQVEQASTNFQVKNIVSDYANNIITVTISNLSGSVLNVNPRVIVVDKLLTL